jgi:hypothetical protein
MKARSSLKQQMRIEREILSHVHQALCIALRAPITSEDASEWQERTVFLTDSFYRHIQRMFAIEEDGGYMDFVIDCPQPTLGGRVDLLCAEHRMLVAELAAVLTEGRATRTENLANLHQMRQRIAGFLNRFDEHRRKECELLYEAFLVDLGGEG